MNVCFVSRLQKQRQSKAKGHDVKNQDKISILKTLKRVFSCFLFFFNAKTDLWGLWKSPWRKFSHQRQKNGVMAVGYASMLDVMSTLALTTVGLSLAHRWPITCWGGITTESTLRSSTAYRTHTACRWHICLLKTNKASRDRCKWLCRDLRLVCRGRRLLWMPRAQGRRDGCSLQRAYNLIWLCGCWHSDLYQGCGRHPQTPQPARCEVRKHTHDPQHTQRCNFSFRCTADKASRSLHRTAKVQGTEIQPTCDCWCCWEEKVLEDCFCTACSI